MVIISILLAVLFTVSILGLVFSALKIRQLYKFSDYLNTEIDNLFSTDRWKTEAIDIDACYDNYGKSMPWNHKFAGMIVYREMR